VDNARHLGARWAIEQAHDAAGGKDVQVSGGSVNRAAGPRRRAGRRAPAAPGPRAARGRVRLFEGVDPERLRLEPTRVLGSDQVTHVRYRVSGG
jgi:hypothetical protein